MIVVNTAYTSTFFAHRRYYRVHSRVDRVHTIRAASGLVMTILHCEVSHRYLYACQHRSAPRNSPNMAAHLSTYRRPRTPRT